MSNMKTVITPEIKKIVKKFRNEGYSISEVARKIKGLYPDDWNHEKVYNSVKKQYYRLARIEKNMPNNIKNSEEFKKDKNCFLSKEVCGDGSTRFEGLINANEAEEITPQDVMKRYGLNPELWEVTSFKMNQWQSHGKDDTAVDLYQFTLKVKPTNAEKVRVSMDKAIKHIDYSKIKPVKLTPYTVKGKDILAINIADLHFGLKAEENEVGEDYNKEIARNRVFNAIREVYAHTYHLKLAKVELITLGDFVHVDNSRQTTTAGTFQQIDGSYHGIVADAQKLLAEIIDTVRDLWKVPVDFLYIPGNHDSDMGFAIANAMVQRYKECKDITFDGGKKEILPKTSKVLTYNGILCGYHHGNVKNKQNRKGLLQQMFRKEYGECEHPNSFLFIGHEHHYAVETASDVSTIICPTLCGPSVWEHGQAYNSPKALRYSIFYADGNVGGGNVYAKDDEV